MGTNDQIDILGNPVLSLPEDPGDPGGFMRTVEPGDLGGARPATIGRGQMTEQPWEDNILTDNWALGPSDRITLGSFHVGDTLRPRTFRRVSQTFTHRPSPDLNETGTFEIHFQGASEAIIRQSTHAMAGPGQAAGSGANALMQGLMALDDGALLPTPTLYAAASHVEVRLRMPGYEMDQAHPVCFQTHTIMGRPLHSAGEIETFTMGNSARELRVIPITYHVGRSIPLTFDIVNHNPTHSVIVDFWVRVYINRTAQNEAEERAEAEARAAEEAAAREPDPLSVRSSMRDGTHGSSNVAPGQETNALDVIAAERERSRWPR